MLYFFRILINIYIFMTSLYYLSLFSILKSYRNHIILRHHLCIKEHSKLLHLYVLFLFHAFILNLIQYLLVFLKSNLHLLSFLFFNTHKLNHKLFFIPIPLIYMLIKIHLFISNENHKIQ